MAVQIYQNQTATEIIVPTANSSMSLYPNEYVGGSYYAHIPELVNVTNQNIDPLDVKYFYPESGESGTSIDGFDTATGTLPIVVTVVDTAFDVSLNPIAASKILSGEIVKSLFTYNGFVWQELKDNVYYEAGAGIAIDATINPVNPGDPQVSTITISNTQLGLTDVYPTAPLYLELGEGNVSLSGEINITATDNGGAVALQSFESGEPIVYQDGYAGLNGLHIATDSTRILGAGYPEWALGFYDRANSNAPLVGIDPTGEIHSSNDINTTAIVRASQFRAYETLTFDPVLGRVNTEGRWIDLQGNTVYETYFDVPVSFKGAIYVGVESTRSAGTHGFIGGGQVNANTSPLINFSKYGTLNATPVIRVSSDSEYPGLTNTTIFEYRDDAGVSLVSIHDDGVVTAKTLEADTLDVTTVFADNIFSTTLYVVGPDTIVMTTDGGPQTIIADCSNGPVVIQLPDLTNFLQSLKVTALKIDTTNNALSFVNGPNSTINGDTTALSIVDQYAGKTITSAGINWYITGTVG